MNSNLPDFTPVLLGSDFNVYGMARSFYELTGKPVKAFAEQQLAPTRFTKIVDLELIDGFADDPQWINSMLKIKERYRDHQEPVILIGCGDGYAELISKHKAELSDVFVCPYIDFDLLKRLNKKNHFMKSVINITCHIRRPKSLQKKCGLVMNQLNNHLIIRWL